VDGAVGAGGNVEGTYLHGVFANPRVRRCLLARLAEQKGIAADPRWGETPAGDRYDRLAAIVGGAIDVSAIAKLVGLSYPRSAS
jgi:adenosylcobyric acid synthase